ncbi:MAG: PH domain-containing protein [Streptomyces sp.]|uniref:PH domain-containing protein n=1 Tax=Streptomyces sp. TaxID=1931 RepID=UPI003D6A253D
MSSESRPEPEPERAPEPESRPESGAGSGADPAPPVYADRCYRSAAAMGGGVLLLLLAAWLGGEALLNGTARTRWLALSGLVCFVPLVVAYTLRPAVYASDRRLRVRNPFRTITVPWGTVEGLRAGYSSEVIADGTKYQLWSIPVSLRARKRASRQTERAARGGGGPARGGGFLGFGGVPVVPEPDDAAERRAPSDQAIDELRALATDNGEKPSAQGEVAVRWAYEIAAPALVGAIALTILFVSG